MTNMSKASDILDKWCADFTPMDECYESYAVVMPGENRVIYFTQDGKMCDEREAWAGDKRDATQLMCDYRMNDVFRWLRIIPVHQFTYGPFAKNGLDPYQSFPTCP
jgi:hypothetical protein